MTFALINNLGSYYFLRFAWRWRLGKRTLGHGACAQKDTVFYVQIYLSISMFYGMGLLLLKGFAWAEPYA